MSHLLQNAHLGSPIQTSQHHSDSPNNVFIWFPVVCYYRLPRPHQQGPVRHPGSICRLTVADASTLKLPRRKIHLIRNNLSYIYVLIFSDFPWLVIHRLPRPIGAGSSPSGSTQENLFSFYFYFSSNWIIIKEGGLFEISLNRFIFRY